MGKVEGAMGQRESVCNLDFWKLEGLAKLWFGQWLGVKEHGVRQEWGLAWMGSRTRKCEGSETREGQRLGEDWKKLSMVEASSARGEMTRCESNMEGSDRERSSKNAEFAELVTGYVILVSHCTALPWVLIFFPIKWRWQPNDLRGYIVYTLLKLSSVSPLAQRFLQIPWAG